MNLQSWRKEAVTSQSYTGWGGSTALPGTQLTGGQRPECGGRSKVTHSSQGSGGQWKADTGCVAEMLIGKADFEVVLTQFSFLVLCQLAIRYSVR